MLLLTIIWRWFATDFFSTTGISSALTASFVEPDELLGLGMGISLLPYASIGTILLVLGSVVLTLRREKVNVTEKITLLLKCPLCKHQWKESNVKDIS